MRRKVLVTGALGCLGAWVVRTLVRQDTPVVALDLADNPHRLELIMTERECQAVKRVSGDITELGPMLKLMASEKVTHVLHLAALQVPACKANPPLGALVNVVGTVNVLEAARRLEMERVVYASSVAVYGPREAYPTPLIPPNAPLMPQTLYGVTKQANEATARIYWQEHRLPSIGLRPYVIYGPGRDQGMTSTPTMAMLAAAKKEPYHISFGGRCGFQYVEDIARVFVQALEVPFEGADIFNIRGTIADMGEVVAAIEQAVPGVKGTITYEPTPLPFPDGQDDGRLQNLLGTFTYTPLTEGVAKTIRVFRNALQEGKTVSPPL